MATRTKLVESNAELAWEDAMSLARNPKGKKPRIPYTEAVVMARVAWDKVMGNPVAG